MLHIVEPPSARRAGADRRLPVAADSVPALVRDACLHYRLPAALHHRDGATWQACSSEELIQRIRRVASGLRAMGLQRGTCVGLLAAPSTGWLIADLAVQLAGGISVPLFPNAADETLRHIAEDADLGWCYVEGERAIRAFATIQDRVDRCFGFDADAGIGSFALSAIASRGRDEDEGPLLADLSGDDLATIIYTSGSTGRPKGVRLTHRNLLSQVAGACRRFPLEPGQDVASSCLPWAHVFERMVLYTYLASGTPVYICDDIARLGERLRDVRPTIMTVVPRLLEKLQAKILTAAEEAPGLRRHLATWALHQAAAGHDHGFGHLVADRLVYRTVRARLGGRLRYVICGGAALAPQVERFFWSIGVPVYQGYGMTEHSPVITTNHPGAHRIGSVGPPFPGVEVRIGEHDEVQARGPGVMQGYHRLPEATAETIDPDGWLHTGDCGSLDDEGFLTITGRIKELMKTAGGKYVCPVPIEQALTAEALVDQAMVVADGRPYVTALLFLDPDALAALKAEAGCAGQADETFASSAPLRRRIEALVQRTNESLDHWQRVRRWQVVTTPPSIENGELTPTMKLKREQVIERHRQDITRLYRRAES